MPRSGDGFVGQKEAGMKFNTIFFHTVCPGSSDPPEKIIDIFASENTPFINYYNTLGWILFVYRAK